jgi:hypothetical protein
MRQRQLVGHFLEISIFLNKFLNLPWVYTKRAELVYSKNRLTTNNIAQKEHLGIERITVADLCWLTFKLFQQVTPVTVCFRFNVAIGIAIAGVKAMQTV